MAITAGAPFAQEGGARFARATDSPAGTGLAATGRDRIDSRPAPPVATDVASERRLRSRVLVPALGVACAFLLATLYWNRRMARENRRRLAAERRLVDMTEGLMTGVFQFRHRPGHGDVEMVFSNRVTREMARVPPDDDDGGRMTFFDHIDPRDRESVKARLRGCLAVGARFRESFRFDFPNGEKGWILADAQCLEERGGTRLWSGYLFDLTAERTMSEELNAVLEDRNEFVSSASHELRTPVQNIVLALDSIDRAAVAPGPLARIDMARSAAGDLEELVNDIVQLTSMNHQSPSLASEDFDLHELVQTVCRTFSVVAVKKSLDYAVHIDGSLPARVRGDALRLKQILYNLVGNAIKYTDRGSVTVTVAPDGAGGPHASDADGAAPPPVRIAVADTGIGIPADSLPSIFEPFATVGPASRRSSGLGLALCDRLAAVMGARIEVESVEGAGSTFAVHLSFAAAGTGRADDPGRADAADPPSFETASSTIMIVDDDPRVSELLATLLAGAGWATRQAGSSEEALALLGRGEERFRAVLTDQRMPGMNGTELARCIRALFGEGTPRPVLILMTGGLRREDAASSPELFDAMLFKPVKTDQIVAIIEGCGRGRDASLAARPGSWGEGTFLMTNA